MPILPISRAVVRRPAYNNKQPEYKYKSRDDFRKYIDFAHNQILELLNQYPQIAGIWLDPIMGFYSNPEIFPIEETYQLIRSNFLDHFIQKALN